MCVPASRAISTGGEAKVYEHILMTSVLRTSAVSFKCDVGMTKNYLLSRRAVGAKYILHTIICCNLFSLHNTDIIYAIPSESEEDSVTAVQYTYYITPILLHHGNNDDVF